MCGRVSVFFYVQTLSGAGHYIRSFEIARELARRHDVLLVDGGRHIPRPAETEVPRLELPRLTRTAQGLAALDSTEPLGSLLARRSAYLRAAVMAQRPHVVVIEHYPFSKWELEPEVNALLAAAREARSGVAAVCSVRDIARQTRFENCPEESYAARVLSRLSSEFTAIMVHGEEHLTPLAAHFRSAGAIKIPVHYTGIVAEPVVKDSALQAGLRPPASDRPYILVSCGGGDDPLDLVGSVAAAVAASAAGDPLHGYRVVACRGLTPAAPVRRASGAWTELAFNDNFMEWLGSAALSVSYAGYNTCANLLAARQRALLLAHPAMSDQPTRAALMERVGAARALRPSELSPQVLAQKIRIALGAPAPAAELVLDGAHRSAAVLEFIADRGDMR
jgi:predicted glycosyltransferase